MQDAAVGSNGHSDHLPIRSRHKVRLGLCCILLAFLLGEVLVMLANQRETNNAPHDAVAAFLDASVAGKVTRMEVYYLGWDKLTTIKVTEASLVSSHYDYRLILNDPDLSRLSEAWKQFEFQRIDWKAADFRLGCIFYKGDTPVLRVFFAHNVPLVAINGVPFKVTADIIEVMLPFLPIQAHDEIVDAMIRRWVQSWPPK